MTSIVGAGLDTLSTLRRLDRSEISAIVRRALEDDRVEVDGWDVHPLGYDYTSPISAGVHRITGTAHHGGRRFSWSLIHRAVRSPAGVQLPDGDVVPPDLPDGPSFFGFWKREPLAYGARLLEDLPGGMFAPRCFGVSERTDGTAWLWLEQVGDRQNPRWTLARCMVAAHVLGRFNGAYLSGLSLPVHPWAGRGWLRSWLDVRIAVLMDEIRKEDTWRHPLVRSAFPLPLVDCMLHLWDDREMLLDGLDRLPHSFCHRDGFRSNHFVGGGMDGRERVVAIDWAYAGVGPVGEEIAPLIVAAPAGDGPELAPWNIETPVFDGYLRGLSEAGWDGEAWLALFGYAASAALRYTLLAVAEMLNDAQHNKRYAAIERRRGQSIDQVMAQHAALIQFLVGLADRARALYPRIAATEMEVPRMA